MAEVDQRSSCESFLTQRQNFLHGRSEDEQIVPQIFFRCQHPASQVTITVPAKRYS